MKKIAMLALLTIFGATAATAQASKTNNAKKPAAPAKTEAVKVEGPSLLFENEVLDYGTIAHNSDGKREFVFTNNGNKPLIITNATGSCGCTVPTYPKEPILPGARAVIGVKYSTDRVGPFSKTVTLTTNAAEPSKVLTIKGNVLPADGPKETHKS